MPNTSQTAVKDTKEAKAMVNTTTSASPNAVTTKANTSVVSGGISGSNKSREQILAEREAKKLAKLAKKSKATNDCAAANTNHSPVITNNVGHVEPIEARDITQVTAKLNETKLQTETEKSREQIKAEREAKKQAKQAAKAAKIAGTSNDLASKNETEPSANVEAATIQPAIVPAEMKKPALTKAERRAIQEAQRAAKAQKDKKPEVQAKAVSPTKTTPVAIKSTHSHSDHVKSASTLPPKIDKNGSKFKLFHHLENCCEDICLFANNTHIHPSIARLGEQYASRTIVGSNARCIAFLNALKMVIQDFETPPKKEFGRSLEVFIKDCVAHLQKCRPLAVSVINVYKHIKHILTQLPTDKPESELKEDLCHFINSYLENQVGKAAQAISSSMQEKISNGDVILTFGCSSLISYICEEAHKRHVDFRVVVIDSRPFCEGQELLRRLTEKGIPCTYVLINAVSFVMPEATKVLLGAHALLSNGYVMARTGTAQVALVAQANNVPVLVCCETHKFSERFQTDAIVYNELGNPDDLVISDKCCLKNWREKNKLTPLNLIYDITPPELVTAVVTEVSILPCTSVPVILRIKPTEIGYYS